MPCLKEDDRGTRYCYVFRCQCMFLGGANELQLRWLVAAQVREGIVPNEHGTWQYGRNGWCDGQQVRIYCT